MGQSFTLAHAARGAANDDCELHFPVELLGQFGIVLDGVAGADHRGRRLGKDHRLVRQIGAGIEGEARFSDVLDIVETDAENVLPWPRDRRQQRHIADRQSRSDWPFIEVGSQHFRCCLHGARTEINKGKHVVGQIDTGLLAQSLQIDHVIGGKRAQTGCGFGAGAIGASFIEFFWLALIRCQKMLVIG